MPELILEGTTIPYQLTRSARAKRLRLSLSADGELAIVMPMRASLAELESVIKHHASWILHQRRRLLAKHSHHLPAYSDRATYLAHKEATRQLVTGKITELSRMQHFPHHRLSIKNHRTRWGSCSKQGNLNFNYRLSLIPIELAEYVIVHELCHLFEMNHSVGFWRRVEALLPDYLARRQQLRSYVWKK